MIRGTKIYKDIDKRIRSTRSELDGLGRDLQRATGRLEQLGVDETRDLGKLARVRLEALEARRVVEGLDSADRRVLELLDQKVHERGRITGDLAASETHQAELEADRTQQLAALDNERARHGEAVAAALAELETTESYPFQRERVETLTAQAERAAEKAAQTEVDREAKGLPYERSRLFSYLWKRRYGTSAYRANNLVRALDDWVARLCGYDRARLDYAMLLEIPSRLREHADHLAADADAERAKLGKMEQLAFEDAGIPLLAEAVASGERALAEIEAALETEEQRHRMLRAARAELDAGEDRFTTEAVDVLRENFEREPVSTLRADAARTPTSADDVLVAGIAAHRGEAKRLRTDVGALRDRQEAVLSELNELEEVRRRYRRNNYDARDSTFRDGLDTGGLLEDLLNGVISVGGVLSEMKRNQRFRVPRRRGPGSGGGISFPDFGSPGRRRGGGGGRSGGGSSRPRPSPPSRPASGGFRTGGGF